MDDEWMSPPRCPCIKEQKEELVHSNKYRIERIFEEIVRANSVYNENSFSDTVSTGGTSILTAELGIKQAERVYSLLTLTCLFKEGSDIFLARVFARRTVMFDNISFRLWFEIADAEDIQRFFTQIRYYLKMRGLCSWDFVKIKENRLVWNFLNSVEWYKRQQQEKKGASLLLKKEKEKEKEKEREVGISKSNRHLLIDFLLKKATPEYQNENMIIKKNYIIEGLDNCSISLFLSNKVRADNLDVHCKFRHDLDTGVDSVFLTVVKKMFPSAGPILQTNVYPNRFDMRKDISVKELMLQIDAEISAYREHIRSQYKTDFRLNGAQIDDIIGTEEDDNTEKVLGGKLMKSHLKQEYARAIVYWGERLVLEENTASLVRMNVIRSELSKAESNYESLSF